MRKFSENKVQSLKKFVQELSWIFDTYKGNTFSDLYDFLAQQEQNKSLELHKCSIPNDKEYLVGVLPRLISRACVGVANFSATVFTSAPILCAVLMQSKRLKAATL